MRKNIALFCLASSALMMTACSTVPSSKTLMTGISPAKVATSSAKPNMLLADDPVCESFYENVITAAVKAQKAKSSNKQLASTGVSILTSVVGLGPIGSMATSSAAQIAMNRSPRNVSTTEFDPEKKFDRKVIKTAQGLGCPLRIKNAVVKTAP